MVMADLANIGTDYCETASLDGDHGGNSKGHPPGRFVAIPTTLFCLVFSVLGAFRSLDGSYMLLPLSGGQNRPGALFSALYMYFAGLSSSNIKSVVSSHQLICCCDGAECFTRTQFGFCRGRAGPEILSGCESGVMG